MARPVTIYRVMLTHCHEQQAIMTLGVGSVRTNCCTPIERAWMVANEEGEVLCLCFKLDAAKAVAKLWNDKV